MPAATVSTEPYGSPRVRTADTSTGPPIVGLRTKRQSLYGPVNSSSEFLCGGGPGYKKASCFASSDNSNVKAVMKSTMPLMDYNDFDNLPPAIRRKYFSSLERLRYAQQSSTVPKPSGHFRSLSSASGRLVGSRMRSRLSGDSFRYQPSPARPKFRKHRNAADAFVLSQSDAQWFLELPETIQRKHFSIEERILLANKCESIIVDAADETLYRMGLQSHNRSFSMSSTSTTSDIESSPHRRSFDSDIQEAREEVRNSFRWMEDDGDLDLGLHQFDDDDDDDHHAARQPFRKRHTLSLSSKTIRSNTSSSNSTSRSRPSFSSRQSSSGPYSPLPPAVSFAQRSTHSGDSEATYYQDPEARLKLRVYFASPQKFDEAIEFGFPSQTEAHNFFKSRPKMPTIRKVYSEDELVEDYAADAHSTMGAAQVDMDVVDETEQWPRMGSSGSDSSNSHPILDRYPHTYPGNREMTLRMTLTRKDLRARENGEQAPALEDLPPETEKSTIDWETIDKESQSGLKRLWRKVKRH